MRTARIQTNDLGRTDVFFGGILSKEEMKETGKPAVNELAKSQQVNGASSPFRVDAKPRFSGPPAPPPQQPLPEKPDSIRVQSSVDPSSPSSLMRSHTERPRSVTSVSPIRSEPTSQIVTLVEALSSAKKELESQSARMRDLEEMLQKERRARESAEEMARRFELQSTDSNINGHAKGGVEGTLLEEAFEPPVDAPHANPSDEPAVDTKAVAESASLLEKKLAAMVVEMEQIKQNMESFRTRAESAELERDTDRKTLSEMVEKIRSEEKLKLSSKAPENMPARNGAVKETQQNGSVKIPLAPLLHKSEKNGSVTEKPAKESSNLGVLSQPPGNSDSLLYQSTPYASMLGVVLIGMGLMAYLNGWQPPKVER